MLVMAAFKFCHPVFELISMKANNLALHIKSVKRKTGPKGPVLLSLLSNWFG